MNEAVRCRNVWLNNRSVDTPTFHRYCFVVIVTVNDVEVEEFFINVRWDLHKLRRLKSFCLFGNLIFNASIYLIIVIRSYFLRTETFVHQVQIQDFPHLLLVAKSRIEKTISRGRLISKSELYVEFLTLLNTLSLRSKTFPIHFNPISPRVHTTTQSTWKSNSGSKGSSNFVIPHSS